MADESVKATFREAVMLSGRVKVGDPALLAAHTFGRMLNVKPELREQFARSIVSQMKGCYNAGTLDPESVSTAVAEYIERSWAHLIPR